MIFPYTLVSVVLVSGISLVGAVTLLLRENTIHRILPGLIGFSTGALLGDVFLHMIPEIGEEGDLAHASALVLFGILLSFVLEKFIHWRHCHLHHCEEHTHPMGTMNLVGEALHNIMDGIAIAASFLVSIPVGISTSIAVALHEIPQELGDIGILLHSGFSRRRAILLNLLVSLTAIAGAMLTLLFASSMPNASGVLLPLTAGNFLYIAGSDLIPELHRQNRGRDAITQFLCIAAGIAMMAGLLWLE